MPWCFRVPWSATLVVVVAVSGSRAVNASIALAEAVTVIVGEVRAVWICCTCRGAAVLVGTTIGVQEAVEVFRLTRALVIAVRDVITIIVACFFSTIVYPIAVPVESSVVAGGRCIGEGVRIIVVAVARARSVVTARCGARAISVSVTCCTVLIVDAITVQVLT